MRKGKLITKVKKIGVIFLATAMLVGLLPLQGVTAKAADTDPYVISKGRMVYASSSVSSSDPSYAADGTTDTRWESAWGNTTEWLYIDLGKTTQITGIKLYWEGAYAKAYKIQTSDDEENWTDIYSTSDSSGGNESLNIRANARYVRIYMTEKFLSAYGYSLYEFEIWGLNGVTKRPENYGTNLAEGKNVTCSAIRDEWWMYDDDGNLKADSVASVQASNAVDGDDGTSFTSYQDNNQWIYVDLGGYYNIGRIILKWGEDAGKVYDIQASNDAQNWTTIYRRLDGYSELEENLPIYATNVRYIRVYGYTKVANGSGFAIKELEVYQYQSGDEQKTYAIDPLPESKIVKANKGSYVTNDIYLDTAKLPTFIDEANISVPIDSNDWWQSSMIKTFGNRMETLPFKTGYSKKGLSILTATAGWLPTMSATDVNVSVITEETPDLYILPENLDTETAYDRVHDYSDYTVDLQLCDESGVAMTSTHVKGSPYIYCDFSNKETVFITASNLTSYFDDNGNAILTENNTITTDHIGIHVTDSDNKEGTKTSSSYYCITLPEGTKVKNSGGKLKITFAGRDRYMSVGTMQNKSQLNTFYQHGYAFVTETAVTYEYSESMSQITSKYNATTELKRNGYSNTTMQLMLPHQWKISRQNSMEYVYPSIRGDMHGVWSNSFTTVDTFEGLLPNFAMPQSDAFDTDKLISYLNTLDTATANLNPAADAYWEGKNLHPLGMGVLMADQIGETEMRDEFLSRLKERLVDWFNYDGEGDVSYLNYDKHWGTLYYSQSEFGANWGICDHHFTYGYFLFGATVLATYDEEFYNDYQDMIEMLIRDYANPSDDDSEYCRFRAYDLYEGHSWAGGYADNDNGNNQESASESLFSWVSMYLWGVLTENETYRDAGVFGFKNEMSAVLQYWFDYDKDNWVEDWPYEVVGQVYGGSNFYGTFFGGQPLYVYGIQWLPISEYLTYYGMNQERCAEIYAGLEADTDRAVNIEIAAGNISSKDEYANPDNGWQHITWPFLSQTNSDLAMEKFFANDTKVQSTDQATTYWFIQSMDELGYKTEDIIATGDLSATVYYNEDTGKYTAQVWNPTDKTKEVSFKVNGSRIGTATIGAKALVSFEVYKNKSFNIVQAETPEISVPTGTYDDTQYVTITSATEGATIYYTTDGSMPNTSSKVYDGVFAVSSTATVKAIAVKDGCINSAMTSSTITVDGTPVSKNTNIALGKTILTSSAENATVDGSKIVDNNGTTRWSSDFTDNEWCQVDLGQNYTINKVTLDWEASYATAYKIQVSGDGNNWTTVYETSKGKGSEEEIIFDAVSCRYVRMQGVDRALDYGYSLWEMGVYEAETVEAPQFSLNSGTYDSVQNVKISSNTRGVEIRYTTDGSTPNENSKLYVPSLKVSNDTTIKAVAYRKGMIPSAVSTAEYKITNAEEPVKATTIPGTIAVDSYSSKTSSITFTTENGVTYAGNLLNGSYLDYQVNVSEKGEYKVILKLAAGDTQYNADSMLIKADGNVMAEVDITGSSSWTNFIEHTANVTFSSTGTHTLTIQSVGGACNVTDIVVEKVPSGSSGAEETETGNIAKGCKTVASGAENDVFASQYAVDGDEGTRWSSDFADDAWIYVDLGKTYAVNKVVLKWEGAYGTDYKIQVSTDGNHWTTVQNLKGQNGGTDTITFDATDARYVKMQGVTRALPYGYSLWEMEVYATDKSSSEGSSDSTYGILSQGKNVSASGAENDVFSPEKAVDGDAGTRWSSNFADDAWITVDLGKTYSVDKVEIRWENAYATAYKIQVSTDGNNWTTVKNLTNQDGGDDTITFTSANARYVRMQGVTRALQYGYSIWEMNVYGK